MLWRCLGKAHEALIALHEAVEASVENVRARACVEALQAAREHAEHGKQRHREAPGEPLQGRWWNHRRVLWWWGRRWWFGRRRGRRW